MLQDSAHIDSLTKDKPEPLTVTHGNYLSDLIPGSTWSLNITRRYPSAGLPPSGTPFRLEIQVGTRFAAPGYVRGMGFHSGGCLDATVVARGVYGANRNRIVALSHIRTSSLAGCTGKATMLFNTGFRPDANGWIYFELYPGRISEAEADEREPLAVSPEMTLHTSDKEGRQTGMISEEQQSIPAAITSSLTGGLTQFSLHTRRITRNVAFVALVGGSIYWLWPHRKAIHRKIENILK